MRKITILTSLMLMFALISAHPVLSQGILKKLKNKTEDKVIDNLFGDDNQSKETGKTGSREGNSSSSSTNNTRGGGLNSSVPDVKANIEDATNAFEGKNYSNARYAVRQAILGIELEIGSNILNDLPETIHGLPAVKEEDNVTSSGIGFIGMVISRVYRKGDTEFRVNIGNDAAMLSAASAYLASGAYGSSSSDQNYKTVKFQDQRAVIEYDEYLGYSLSVPFGQSSVLVTEGVNFSTEDDFMSASNEIELSNIKNQLGEK
ncbi:MAG: hypothetical protein KQI35_08280 [Bacteroidetes bacterium]|nr:hypothetical protein [Bacteroidota bacterium]